MKTDIIFNKDMGDLVRFQDKFYIAKWWVTTQPDQGGEYNGWCEIEVQCKKEVKINHNCASGTESQLVIPGKNLEV